MVGSPHMIVITQQEFYLGQGFDRASCVIVDKEE